MISFPRVVVVVLSGFLLCVSLSTVASSADTLTVGQPGGKIFTVDDKDNFVPGKVVRGKIVKVDGENYVVREASGNEVRMHVDSSTTTKSNLIPKMGENVIAKVDDKGHALSFLTDRPQSH